MWIGGVVVGRINVKRDDSGSGETKGQIRFELKRGTSLSVDPIGQSLLIEQGSEIFFADRIPSSPSEVGDSELQVGLTNAGILPGAEGEAEYRRRNGRTDFSVEIEDVPAGDYLLRVNGTVLVFIILVFQFRAFIPAIVILAAFSRRNLVRNPG